LAIADRMNRLLQSSVRPPSREEIARVVVNELSSLVQLEAT
jgi:hypothetical protein